MHADLFGVAFGSISASVVLKIADQLLLLGVHRDDWIAGGQFLLGARIDELELSIAVRMCGTLLGLLVGLKTVAHAAQSFDRFRALAQDNGIHPGTLYQLPRR